MTSWGALRMRSDHALKLVATLDPATRSIVEDRLGDVVRIEYLGEVAEVQKPEILERAEILLCLDPEQEIGGAWPAAPAWRFVQFITAGIDYVDFNRFPASTVIASNVGGFSEPIAEHALAMALALCKRLPQQHRRLQQGVFDQFSDTGTLRGKTAAILGFGGIGKACADLLRAFEIRIHAVNRTGRTDYPVEHCSTLLDLEGVLRVADLVVISLPLTRETRGLLGKRELGWLKDDVILINVARGEIIEEEALYEFLVAHPEAQAGIDAWWIEPFRHGRFRTEYPFLELPNVLGSPHNSWRASGWEPVALQRACDNIARYIAGQAPKGLVDRALYRPV